MIPIIAVVVLVLVVAYVGITYEDLKRQKMEDELIQRSRELHEARLSPLENEVAGALANLFMGDRSKP